MPFFILLISAGFLFAQNLDIVSPPESRKLLPGEEVRVSVDKPAGFPFTLYYKTELDADYILVAEDVFESEAVFNCPDFFFDSLQIKAISSGIGKPELIFAEAVDEETFGFSMYRISGLDFSAGGRYIVGAGETGVFTFDTHTGEAISRVNNGFKVNNAVFPRESDSVFYCEYVIGKKEGRYGLIKNRIDLSYPELLFDIESPEPDGCLVDISESGSMLIAGLKSNLAVYYDPNNQETKIAELKEGTEIYSAKLIEDEGKIIVGTYTGETRFYDLDFRLIRTFQYPDKSVNTTPVLQACSVSPDNRYYAIGGIPGDLYVRDMNSHEIVFEGKHGSQIHGIDFHPTEPLVLTASFDRTCVEWNYETGEKNFELENGFQCLEARYSPSGDTIVCAGRSDSLKMWRRPQKYADTVSMAMQGDYAGTFFIEEAEGYPGDYKKIHSFLTLDERLSEYSFDADIDLKIRIPEDIIFFPGEFMSDSIVINCSPNLVSGRVGSFYVGFLRSSNRVGRTEISEIEVRTPRKAKFRISGAEVFCDRMCSGETPGISFISGFEIRTEGKNIELSVYSASNATVRIGIYDSSGRLIKKQKLILQKGLTRHRIQDAVSASGVYFLTGEIDEETYFKKFLIGK